MLKLGGLAQVLTMKYHTPLERARLKLREHLEKKAAGNVPPITSNITAGAPRPPTPAVPGGKVGLSPSTGYTKFNPGAPPQRLNIGPKPPSGLHVPEAPKWRSAATTTAGFADVAKAAKPAAATTAGKMVRTAVRAAL